MEHSLRTAVNNWFKRTFQATTVKNFYLHLVAIIARSCRSLEVLPRVTGFTSTGADNITIPTVDIGTAYDAVTAKRLKTLELTPGYNGLLNLAMASPAMLSNSSPHVVLASDGMPATLFLVGMATNSSLLSGTVSRQISVAFSGHTFPRALAVLGRVVPAPRLWAPSFKGGLALSSYRKKPGMSTRSFQ